MKEFLSNSVFFGAVLSLVAYEAGLLLRRKFKLAILNPLLIATICVLAVLVLFKVDYDQYNESAKYISYLLTRLRCVWPFPLRTDVTFKEKF